MFLLEDCEKLFSPVQQYYDPCVPCYSNCQHVTLKTDVCIIKEVSMMM